MSENHSHLVDQTNNDLTQIQNQLKMLIGVCVLQSQKFEHLMKKKLGFNQSIVMDNKGNIVTSNRLDLVNKPLGCLIEQFFKSITPTENFIEDNDSIGVKEVENWNQKNFFYAKRNSFMPQAELDKLKSEWKELLDSRNRLVHHFYVDNTISTIEGCLIAKDRLTTLAKQMDANLVQMQHYLNKDKICSEILSSDFIVEIIDSLINTDEEVEALQLMIKELTVATKLFGKEGWTVLENAKQWITNKHPQLFSACGYKSWQQLVHESQTFNLIYRNLGAKKQACYQVRLTKTI